MADKQTGTGARGSNEKKPSQGRSKQVANPVFAKNRSKQKKGD